MEHLVFTLVTFVLFTALVGIISGKIVKNSDDQKTAKGYFLAGNGLGGFFIAGSMLHMTVPTNLPDFLPTDS